MHKLVDVFYGYAGDAETRAGGSSKWSPDHASTLRTRRSVPDVAGFSTRVRSGRS